MIAGALLGVFLSSCGGGGGSSADSGGGATLPAKILSWSPPNAYTDQTPLNPAVDLDSFEIYVNTSGSFGYSDVPLAYVRAVEPGSGQVTSQFNLANLAVYLSAGVPYKVSVRAVALTGAKSDFSPVATFSF